MATIINIIKNKIITEKLSKPIFLYYSEIGLNAPYVKSYSLNSIKYVANKQYMKQMMNKIKDE